MPISRILILLILISLAFKTKAEKTFGFCYLQEEPDGINIAELEGDIYLMTLPEHKNYFKVLLECYIYKKDLYDDLRINKKVKLYNANHQKIGKTIIDFNPMKFVFENDSMVLVQLSGYIHKASINPESVPEIDLSNLLMNAEINAKFEYFEPHIKKFGYVSFNEEQQYTSYIIYEPDFVKQALNPRILMIFYQKELIAIFYTRQLNVKHYDSIEMGNEYKMIYNSKFTEHTKTQMMSIYKNKIMLH
ncbi:MAG: hypothetical protein ACK4K9_08035 [Bacteroidia bacterium]